MNRRTYSITLLAAFIVVACGNPAKDHGSHEHEHTEHEHADNNHVSHNEHTEGDGIVLNDGAKWKVNEDMLPHIKAMESAIIDFTSTEAAAYNELGVLLKEHNKNLISSCTMKGASHNELHKWLHPYMELIENISNAEDAGSGERLLGELKASFETFHTYFE